MVEVQCKHQDHPHTLWYWLNDDNDPFLVPYVLHYDDMHDAVEAANIIISKTLRYPENSVLTWVKVFRSDNEEYECYRWERDLARFPLPNRTEPPERTMQNASERADDQGRSWWRRLLGR
jgi:hypothetical protein